MVDGCILIEIQHGQNKCSTHTEVAQNLAIHHEYTMNTPWIHATPTWEGDFQHPSSQEVHLPRCRQVPGCPGATSRGAHSMGGFGRLCTRLWRRGRRFQHRFVDFGHWDWLEAALPILLVGWSLWPNQKGSNLPNERLNQSKISELSKTWGLNQPKLGVNQPKIGMVTMVEWQSWAELWGWTSLDSWVKPVLVMHQPWFWKRSFWYHGEPSLSRPQRVGPQVFNDFC